MTITEKLNALAIGFAAAILSAALMLLLGMAGNLGVYTGAVQMMQQWHFVFDLSVIGIIGGMIEGAVIGFIGGYAFGRLYNQFA